MRQTSLAKDMKAYEKANKAMPLSPQQWTIIRVDGKAFHSYTRGFDKPFDEDILFAMDAALQGLSSEIPGASFGYAQSDEISIIIPPGTKPTSQLWFDGKTDKINSVAASIATLWFNRYIDRRVHFREDYTGPEAYFDARSFSVPDKKDAVDYILWRRMDAERNSVSAAAQAHFSHKQLQGLSRTDMLNALDEKGIDFHTEYSVASRNGWISYKESTEETITYTRKDTQEVLSEDVVRNNWVFSAAPDFDFIEFVRDKIDRNTVVV